MSLHPDLLAILACPVCKGDLDLVGEEEGFLCSKCALVYPVVEEIPVMIVKEAIKKEDWEKGQRSVVPEISSK